VGVTTNTYTVTDAGGLQSSCSFTVTVTDTQAPSITCPGPIAVNNDPGVCGATVTYTAPVGTDNCPGATTTRTAGLASGSVFPVGVTTNTYTVTDAGGLQSSCSFTVTVTDTQAPVITCPGNIEQLTDPGENYATVAVGTATATDNCSYSINGVRSDGQGLADPYPVGVITITWTVTDGAGLTDDCIQTITVLPSYGLTLSLFLQGPFNTVTGEMNPILKSNDQVPTSQPYNTPPWNYTGTESVATLDDEVVDWILVELRSDLTTVHTRKAGLLYADGSARVSFYGLVNGTDDFYVVVRHRNHMPIMSANKIVIPETGAFLDMTTLASAYGTKPMIQLVPTNLYGMIAGEVITDGQLKYSGPYNDRGPIIAKIVAIGGPGTPTSATFSNGYWVEDVNMNNQLKYIGNQNDRGYIIANISTLLPTVLLTDIYHSEVPGEWDGKKKSQMVSDGPVNIHLSGSRQGVQVVLNTSESIQEGLFDNLQFTLAWNAGDSEMDEMMSAYTSDFMLNQQGGPIQVGNKKYLVFATVTPTYLPPVWNPGEEITVLYFDTDYDGQIINRLWIADDSFTDQSNGIYYVSIWGTDYTGMIEDPVVVSIDEFNPTLSVNVYPNPVHNGKVMIHLLATQNQNLMINIFDVRSNLLMNLPWQTFSGHTTRELDLSALPPGAYMLSIIGKHMNYQKKLILLTLN
jgi:hypothetical protein